MFFDDKKFYSQLKLQCFISFTLKGNRNSQTSLNFDIEFKLDNICLIEIETYYKPE